jgi:hypothetical protein
LAACPDVYLDERLVTHCRLPYLRRITIMR